MTVCHPLMGGLLCGFSSDDQEDPSLMDVCTPVADWVPSTPADIGESTDDSSVEPFTVFVFDSSGGEVGAIPTFL